jgi:hypothetical protein
MKTSPSNTSPQKDQQVGDGNGNTNAALRETQLGANSASLGKRMRTAVGDDGQLRMPLKKKHASESPNFLRRTEFLSSLSDRKDIQTTQSRLWIPKS